MHFSPKIGTLGSSFAQLCPEEAANTVLGFLMRPGICRVDDFLLLAAIVPKFNPNCSEIFDFDNRMLPLFVDLVTSKTKRIAFLCRCEFILTPH